MISSAAALAALRSSTDALLADLQREEWGEDDVRAASLLPGWTRGHVLTHVARNADGITRTVTGALRGEILARYPAGRAGRNADIEAGAGRGFAELVDDVRSSAERLDAAFADAASGDAAGSGGWHLPADDRTVGEYLLARWREVEVHRVDLGGAYGPADWPPAFVSYLLPELIGAVEPRVSQPLRIEVIAAGSVTSDLVGSTREVGGEAGAGTDRRLVAGPDWAVLAWLTGRVGAAGGQLGDAPELAPWL